jgi:hypothetical protein
MKRTLLIFAVIIFTSIRSFSQTEQDTLTEPVDFIENTDSLLVLNDSVLINQNLNIPDSIYMQRLSALPFEFKMTYNPIVRS